MLAVWGELCKNFIENIWFVEESLKKIFFDNFVKPNLEIILNLSLNLFFFKTILHTN